MNDVATDLASRFLQGVGLAECPFGIAEQRLMTYRRGSATSWRLVGTTTTTAEALNFLSTLTWPVTRHVLFANGATLTAFINNSRNGSDYADDVFHLPQHLNCRFARVVNCRQRVWRRGRLRVVQQYAARIFDLRDARGETIRSITCMNDGGRWVYHATGVPLPIEAAFSDSVTRISARFSPEQLVAIASACGFRLPTAQQFNLAEHYVMFAQDSVSPIGTCTIAEADDPAYGYFLRGMGYVAHMDTHAASVVADFERCLAINPEYEPRVREYLKEARRRLA
jgi:hypothetical protein